MTDIPTHPSTTTVLNFSRIGWSCPTCGVSINPDFSICPCCLKKDLPISIPPSPIVPYVPDFPLPPNPIIPIVPYNPNNWMYGYWKTNKITCENDKKNLNK